MIYETTVDAKGNWAICEEGGGDVVADLMTEENAIKICATLNMWETKKENKNDNSNT